jgi:molybdate transport system ATP-binding protein
VSGPVRNPSQLSSAAGTDAGSLLEARILRGNAPLNVQVEWNAQTLVLFGPSGAGKTTLLRVLLGLEPRAESRVRLAGHWLEDGARGLRTPVYARRLGWVPQSPTLFPDRNVERNIRFGAREAASESSIQQAIEVLELGELLSRSVTSLSGGERGRVALARAIAIRPRALLLDEPLAALDVSLRRRILPYLIRIREELALPIVHITHDPDEAILLGDEIVVLNEGRVVAQGPPRETLWSQAVYSLGGELGIENLIEVRGVSGAADTRRVRTEGGVELEAPWPVASGEALALAVRTEDVLLALDRPDRISARNRLPGRVAQIEKHPDHVLVHVALRDLEIASKITAGAAADLGLEVGQEVYLVIKSQALRRVR